MAATLKVHSKMLAGLKQASKALAKDVFLVGDKVLKPEARRQYKILVRSCIPSKKALPKGEGLNLHLKEKAGMFSEAHLLRDGRLCWALRSQNPESGSGFAGILGLHWFMLPDPGHPGWLKYTNFFMVLRLDEVGGRQVRVYRKPIGCKTFEGCVEVDLGQVEVYG